MASTPKNLSLQPRTLAPRPEHRAYVPHGAAQQLWWSQATEVLLSGPAGTGKSRACLEKLHWTAERYPGMRGLILRKTRESLAESALVTWEEKVVPANHPILNGPQRDSRKVYRYPNGSEVIVAGLRQSGRNETQRVMSTEYDIIFVQEAIELNEDDWEKATTRLRNGKTPYGQLMADTNPDRPTHWLKKRCDAGKTVLLESRHEDNPVLWDRARNQPTEAGGTYIGILDGLTGPRKQRLRYGRWVQAEGVVYEGWDAAVHLVDRFEIPADWTRYLSIDFGFTHPFVCQWWAVDPDGRLWLYREIFQMGLLVEDAAAQIKALQATEPRARILLAVCDHDAEDRATLAKHLGVATVAARKEVSPGIQAVASRLKRAKDGKPRIFLLRGSLVRRDPALAAKHKPCCTAEEFDGYVWDEGGHRNKGEEPVKENDHGLDALRYMAAQLDFGTQWNGKITLPPRPVAAARAPKGVFNDDAEGGW